MSHEPIRNDLTISWSEKCSCYSLNLPARISCPGVAERMKDPKSICWFCYAWSSNFRLPASAKILNANLKFIKLNGYTASAIALDRVISFIPRKHRGYFRFFGSGDIPTDQFAMAILHVAASNPDVWFWLPTQNRSVYDRLLYGNDKKNLAIRLSTPRINDTAPRGGSCVFTDRPPAKHFVCKGDCIKCRECWLSPKTRIAFPFHGSNATVKQLAKARKIGKW